MLRRWRRHGGCAQNFRERVDWVGSNADSRKVGSKTEGTRHAGAYLRGVGNESYVDEACLELDAETEAALAEMMVEPEWAEGE